MDKRKLENKADKKPRSKKIPKKVSNKYIVVEEFCGIKKGTPLVIENKDRASRMISKGYVKIKD